MKDSLCQKLLGISFDYRLNLAKHFETCQKSSRKLNGLARLEPYMTSSKLRTLMGAFFKPQFNYYPLVWRRLIVIQTIK